MTFLFVLVLVLVILPAVVGYVTESAAERRGRRRLLDSLRGRWLKNAGAIGEFQNETRVGFELGGRPARLRLSDRGRTLVEVGGHLRADDRLHLFMTGGHGERPGVEDLRVGDPVFDRAWIVQGHLARRLFAPESRAEVVAAVHALRKWRDPCVEVRGGVLRASVAGAPDALGIRALLRAAEAVLEALGPRVDDGVVWLEVRHDARAVCQVCGSDEGRGRVACRSCRTPHHEDCWVYARRCSTYGCGEGRFVRL